MTRTSEADAASQKAKRPYRKGNAMTASEKQLASVARKRLTHKEINVFVRNAVKDNLIQFCAEDGLTQGQFIEKLLELEAGRRRKKVNG
ncbi:replication regulatory protein RepA [Erwinia amylovora]|uniref:replication regulatory protein RepA n=1 Tax=Erwinia amylovora TaxID=552 RepID=UPI0001CCB7DE|nr:replication regulatory protein RepA [Erwinia amylovora]CBJ48201.1 replication regulatory protein [Erwinia amylovora ATCC 49946]